MTNLNAPARPVKRGWICAYCKHHGPDEHFREWLLDRAAGVAGPCTCQECRKPRPVDYERRNRFLKVLGYNCYSHYLHSEMWKTIRAMVLNRDNGRCVRAGCGRPATDVHHNSYEIDVLIGKDLRQLVSLCRDHHRQAEFDVEGQKRSLPEVRNVLKDAGVAMPKLDHRPLPKSVCGRPKDISPATKARLVEIQRQLREAEDREKLYEIGTPRHGEAKAATRRLLRKTNRFRLMLLRGGSPR
jgi:hypothetical protein